MKVTLKDGTKTTAKRLAANCVYEKISGWCVVGDSDDDRLDSLTDKQFEEVRRHWTKAVAKIEADMRKKMAPDFE